MKKILLVAALGAIAAMSLPAAAQDLTLRMHHFVPPKAPPHARFMAMLRERFAVGRAEHAFDELES